MIYWFYLLIAVLFEVMGTMALKYSSITNNTLYSWLTALLYFVSFSLMWYAIKKIDISIAYAIWAGLGTALIAVIGYMMFNEQMGMAKIICIALIVIGVAGLKYTSAV